MNLAWKTENSCNQKMKGQLSYLQTKLYQKKQVSNLETNHCWTCSAETGIIAAYAKPSTEDMARSKSAKMIGELVVSAGLLKSSSLGRIGKVSVTGIWHFIQGRFLFVCRSDPGGSPPVLVRFLGWVCWIVLKKHDVKLNSDDRSALRFGSKDSMVEVCSMLSHFLVVLFIVFSCVTMHRYGNWYQFRWAGIFQTWVVQPLPRFDDFLGTMSRPIPLQSRQCLVRCPKLMELAHLIRWLQDENLSTILFDGAGPFCWKLNSNDLLIIQFLEFARFVFCFTYLFWMGDVFFSPKHGSNWGGIILWCNPT